MRTSSSCSSAPRGCRAFRVVGAFSVRDREGILRHRGASQFKLEFPFRLANRSSQGNELFEAKGGERLTVSAKYDPIVRRRILPFADRAAPSVHHVDAVGQVSTCLVQEVPEVTNHQAAEMDRLDVFAKQVTCTHDPASGRQERRWRLSWLL